MSNQTIDPDADDGRTESLDEETLDADEYGSLTVEDEPGTVNPADLAGTASDDDASVGYEPEFSEADELED